MNKNSKTCIKETRGDDAIKQYNIWDRFFPGNTGWKKVTDKKMQKAGVDYIIYGAHGEEMYVDLKTGIGDDYTDGGYAVVAIEIYQNDWFTNTDHKMTDFMLYYTNDKYGERFFLYDYDDIKKVSEEHRKKLIYKEDVDMYTYKNEGSFQWHKSFNGTGIYIRMPFDYIPVLKQYASEE